MRIQESQELQTSPVRVLVADDFEFWQTFVHDQLDREPHLRVIAVAGDGLEAVQKAKELQPDLIVLDIGLQKLNGIEAARRIRKAAPRAKILFLSANADAEVVSAAFNAGALGYIHKSTAAQSLLPGMEAVLLGKRFIACNLKGLEDFT
jgi:DNA-binding NarL/FixJ family response regulator